jgi:hypothetical protein
MNNYRVEINALYYKDIEASSEKEALKQVDTTKSFNGDNDGTFFYEEFDFKNAKIAKQI